jgi:nicotinate-nucleotide adenylyltransferase
LSRRRVGVLGGTFDPIHDAHLELARRARDQVPLDEVWFLPAHRPPHKTKRPVTEASHRLAMLRLALAGEAGLAVCTLETDDPRVHTTVESLAELTHRHPECDFFLVLGEDGFRALSTWVRPHELARHCEWVVCPRPGGAADRPRRAFGSRVHWLEGELMELSSTGSRRRLRRGEAAPGVPPDVLEYIRAQGLYAEEEA